MADKRGWTPIIEPLARERGLVSAAVFGIVQRHCKMAKGVCDASLETMAEMIGSDRSTVLRHIKKLCEAGYLKDLTPNLRNSPHIYEDTGKVDLMAQTDNASDKSVSMRNSLDNVSDKSVAHNNSSIPTVAHSNTSKDGSDKSVAESHLKKQDSSLIVSSPKKVSKGESPLFELLTQALAKICKINLETIGRTTGKELLATQDAFNRIGITPAQVLEFDQWRKAHHWSGKKGNDPPSLKQVGEFWGQYEDWVKRDRPDPPTQPQNGATHGTHRQNNQQPTDRPATYDKSAHDAELEALANPRAHPG